MRGTRTHIIDADGTSFVPITQAQRKRRKIIAIVSLIASSPFVIGAFVGIGIAIKDQASAAPVISPTLTKAIEACDAAPREFEGYCIGLYLRPAYTLDIEGGATSHTPAGPALVKECFEQDLDRSDLGACLTQPIS